MPMATSPMPWFAQPRGIYQMPLVEDKLNEKMSTVITHPPASPPNYSAIRLVRMDKVERYSPRPLTPEECREDATPLDFSRASTTPIEDPSPHGAVDLCTRGDSSPDFKTEDKKNAVDQLSPTSIDAVSEVVPQQSIVQQYPFHSALLHQQQYMIRGPSSEPTNAREAVSPKTANFQGIISLTPPPPLPLNDALPLSPIQQPPLPPVLPVPLHQTLAAANACKSDSKATRPFKAYPKDPLTLTVGVSTAESLLGQASNEAYVEFRKRMLQQVAATKVRRPNATQQTEEGSNSAESMESMPQNNQSSSSGDEDGTPLSKKRSRTNSESNSPYGVVKDAAYWERRRKNNEAAKRSRDARRAKEDEIAIRAAFLEQENLRLKYEVAALRHETSNLRCLLYSAANSS